MKRQKVVNTKMAIGEVKAKVSKAETRIIKNIEIKVKPQKKALLSVKETLGSC